MFLYKYDEIISDKLQFKCDEVIADIMLQLMYHYQYICINSAECLHNIHLIIVNYMKYIENLN